MNPANRVTAEAAMENPSPPLSLGRQASPAVHKVQKQIPGYNEVYGTAAVQKQIPGYNEVYGTAAVQKQIPGYNEVYGTAASL